MNEQIEMSPNAVLSQIRRWSALTVLTVAIFAMAACSGGTGHGSATRVGRLSDNPPAAADVAAFCRDYAAAAYAYQESFGDTSDPSFDQFLSLLAKAKAEAPPAVASQVATMYAVAVRVQNSNGTGDLTTESKVVSDWADTNCSDATQGAGATPSDATSSPSGAASTTTSDASGDSGSATPDIAGFCSVVWDVTENLATLDTNAIGGGLDGPVPTASNWQQAKSAVGDLAERAPLTRVGTFTVQQDVNTIATDLDDIIANGHDNSNGGANLQQDIGTVQADAIRLNCPRPN
jgi:hypothetical protein